MACRKSPSYRVYCSDWYQGRRFGYDARSIFQNRVRVLPFFQAAAEGATRSETLRQMDCESGLTLESGRIVGPPKGRGKGWLFTRSLR